MNVFREQAGGPAPMGRARWLPMILVFLGLGVLGTLPTLGAEEPTVLTGHEGGVTCAAFSPDGKTLVTGATDGIFKVWDTATGKAITEVDAHEKSIFSMVFTSDGALLATGCGNLKPRDFTVKLWDTKTWKELPRLEGGHPGYIRGVAFVAGGKLLAAGNSAALLRVWDVSSRKLRYSQQFLAWIFDVDVFPGGKVLALIDSVGEVHLWDVAAVKETARWHVSGGRGCGVRCAPDGKSLATVAPQTVELWDPAGRALANWKPEEGRNLVGPLAFSPDGRILVASDTEKTVYLLDGKTLQVRGSFHPHRECPVVLAFSPDGKHLVTGGQDNLVKIWDVAKLLEGGAPKK